MMAATKRTTAKAPDQLRVTLFGVTMALDPLALTIREKQKWRDYLKLLPDADEADHFFCLALVFAQRERPDLSFDEALDELTWSDVNTAIADGRPVEASHPQS